MPKNNCLFQARRLEDERFKHRIRKKMTLMHKDFGVANMEEAALTLHMKGKKHVKSYFSDQCIKSLMPPTPAPPLIIMKICLSGVLSFQ